VAAMRLSGGQKPQLDLSRLCIDPSRPDWGNNASGKALVDALGFMRVSKPDTPAWALAGEGLAAPPNSKKQKKDKKDKKEKKKKKREKKKKKDKKSKEKASTSSSSNGSSSSSSSGSKPKARRSKKARKEGKRKDGGSEAEASVMTASTGPVTGKDTILVDGEEGEAGAVKKCRKMEAEASAASTVMEAPAEEALAASLEAPTTSPELSPFPGLLAGLERHDLSVLDDAVGFLAPGTNPEQQQAAIAGALAGLLKASVDPTGINRIAVARAGAIAPLVQLLKSNTQELQLQAAWALHNLTSKNADNKEAVVRDGAAGPLVAVLRSGSPEAKAQVVGVLRNLTGGSAGCKAAVEAAGAIPSVVALLAKGASAPQVQANLAVVLYNLCKDNMERRVLVYRAGAIPVLIAMLGGGVPQVQQEAADTLRIMVSNSKDYCSAAISAGIAPVLAVATGAMAAAKLRQQAGLLKRELARCGGPDVQRALH